MKNKFLLTILSICCVLACVFGLAACGGGNSHAHDYIRRYDETYHWQECTNDGCMAKTIDRATHTFGANNRCTVCGYEKGTVVVPGEDKLSVAGYTYTFSSVEVKANVDNEILYKVAELAQAEMQESMSGATMSFSTDGSCSSTSSGETFYGTYSQSGAKVTATINGVTSQITATENSIIAIEYEPYENDNEEKPWILPSFPSLPNLPNDNDEQNPVNPDDKNEPTMPDVPEQSETERKTCSAVALSTDVRSGFTITITYVKGSGGNKPINPDKPNNGECDHNYVKYINVGDKEFHIVYCNKCGSKNKEAHDFSKSDDRCYLCDYKDKEEPEIPDISEIVHFELNSDGESYSVRKTSAFNETEFVIPAEYNGKPVTTISDNAFKNCSSLTSVNS